MYKLFLLSLASLLISCGNRDVPAPVSEIGSVGASFPALGHKVKRGETLFAIAFLYDVDYKQLAKINNINPPYNLAIGQVIKFKLTNNQPYRKYPQMYSKSNRTYFRQKRQYNTPPRQIYPQRNGKWLWPVKGQVKTSFAPFMARKGIDISGKKGDKIYAAQSGVVAYAGSGLANYGNLIIIKHPNNYLTAYGNNVRNLVKEGQYVNAGQVIAEMGIINHQYYGLHFEIRQQGKPLNPLLFLRR